MNLSRMILSNSSSSFVFSGVVFKDGSLFSFSESDSDVDSELVTINDRFWDGFGCRFFLAVRGKERLLGCSLNFSPRVITISSSLSVSGMTRILDC